MKNNKYKVYPGLTPNSREIMHRMKNRSFNPAQDGIYSLDVNFDEARRMTKGDLRLKAAEYKDKADTLSKKIKTT